MASFTDKLGRSWSMRVDWAAMRRAKAAGVDLSHAEELLGDFFRGSVVLADAVWSVVEPQATSQGVTRDAFEAAVCQETIEAAREALLEGLANFFSPSRAELLTAGVAEVSEQIRSLAEISRKRFSGSPEPSGA